jgi:hypothetical protein
MSARWSAASEQNKSEGLGIEREAERSMFIEVTAVL